MEYDFDAVVDRRNTGSLKWEVGEGELPMWVADMDFQTAPEIRSAILARAEHGVFGYNIVPPEWYHAYQDWWERRHAFPIEKEWLIFCTGVVPAISSIVRKLTSPAEKVLIQTPVYNIFFNSIYNNGRNIVENQLHYENGEYSIDFVELEEKLSDPQTSLMILCNPHNPVGKVWDKETLERIGALCAKHAVVVVSDEIHCDLTDPFVEYVPFASVSEECKHNSITCMAPTKAFNLAGLQTAAVCIENPVLRHKVCRGLNTDEVAEPGSFAVAAAVAAFTEGEKWLCALREYIYENKQRVAAYLRAEVHELTLIESKATYLLWIDCRGICTDASELSAFLRRETGLYVSDGAQYGEGGRGFLRMNVACTRAVLEDGLSRLREGVARWKTHRNEVDTL